ncbi:MAG TPA: hypothetical protein VH082_03895 [Rudaea sp.]|jgi:hypothetical protein|nr:hypothetical protein [Rudaea sp.]
MRTNRSSPSWLPLLAHCAFIASLFCPVVFLAVYPDRKAERDDYERAQPCSAGAHDSGSCRLITEATITGGECRYTLNPSPDDFCEMRLRIGDLDRYIGVDRSRIDSGKPGATIRVEVFRSLPTAIVDNDRLIEQRGSPREAIEKLKLTMVIWSVIAVISGAYLYHLRRIRLRDGMPQKS